MWLFDDHPANQDQGRSGRDPGYGDRNGGMTKTLPRWTQLLAEHYGPFRVVDDRTQRDPAGQVGEDLRLAGPILESDPQAPSPPVFRVWSNAQCLVATRREERLDGFEAARRTSEARGWPVVVRDSGGMIVPHLTGSLHLTLLLPRRDGGEPGTDQVYRLLCEPVREALATLGIDASYGQVPRSFCDGRYNLVHDGRKLAGTAQRWRGGIPGHPVRPGLILSHLTLWVEGDMAGATRTVNRFLDEAGGEGDFDPEAATTVRRATGGGAGSPAPDGGWLEATRQALLAELRKA